MSEREAKKRKTTGAITKAKLSRKRKMTVKWPQGDVPVEIFAIIISFLSRSNVQNMRLVNKEFEVKVSQFLFKTVVVPFKPEIYGIAEASSTRARNATEVDHQRKLAVMLQDKGMRVFQGFGRHIHRFAMSFEFDYGQLTKPPLKSDQEAITTFWGIYRWPYKGYHRYEALEGLEQTADETRTMAKALRYIEKCKELGLSIDGGLGWLAGPDANSLVQNASEKAVVFGPSVFCPEEKPNVPKPMSSKYTSRALDLASIAEVNWSGSDIHSPTSDDDGRSSAWLQMLREAGYEGRNLLQSILTLRESEGISSMTTPDYSFDSVSTMNPISSSPPHNTLQNSTAAEMLLQRIGHEGTILNRMRSLLNHEIEDERRLAGLNQADSHLISSRNATTEISSNEYPLKPNELTNAQKEMLLETEWAQRAFMQSYAIAVIDNPVTFQKVETLTIARLPSRHLSILTRADFWSSLSCLKSVSLAVIPDWRDVVKLPTSWVDDIRVQPSQAVSGAYQLLKDHISIKKSIKKLHFEWLCGGEEAPGIFARNQHIIAAPLLPQPLAMLSQIPRFVDMEPLSLPHVQHLSLKNCWVSFHSLLNFAKGLRKEALQSLTLHSVSLTAPLPHGDNNAPHLANPLLLGGQQLPIHAHINAINQQPAAMNNQGGLFLHVPHVNHPAQAQGVVATATQPPLDPDAWLGPPRYGSWADFIDRITPGQTLADIRLARDAEEIPPGPDPTDLRIIRFLSCGYVRLPLDFDQSMLDPPEGRQVPDNATAAAKRRTELEKFMMKAHDRFLGTVVNYISAEETKTLENAWALRVGWGEGGKILAAQALADGVKDAGKGRFTGMILGSQP